MLTDENTPLTKKNKNKNETKHVNIMPLTKNTLVFEQEKQVRNL